MAQAQPHMGGQKPMGRPSRGAPGPEGTDPRGGVAAPREAAPRKGDQPKGSGQRTHLAPKTHRDGAGAQNTPGKGGRNGTTPEGVNGQTGHGGPPDSLGKGDRRSRSIPIIPVDGTHPGQTRPQTQVEGHRGRPTTEGDHSAALRGEG